ncbi:SMC-Scp complex subunit ScpB [Sedimentibacter sp. zth1]|uniref:SMC-Scp complex subunit ScpB n=1 Tax=Sedimentibacter sp. zth1 TaxID=2816908 RepID=UPI001F5EC707|nr:SMC-Scp complex subunit ScpB [Sedimentibacter sp. zth1]
MKNEKIKSIIESLLFVWGEPLKLSEISNILNMKHTETIQVLTEMVEEYNKDEKRGLLLRQFGDTYQLTTKSENYEYINLLMQESTTTKSLSTAALETLSIVAYKQPVTRVEIDIIRGVKSSNIVKGLMEKGLVKEVGKLDKPGKPTLFGTTAEFLKHFGLKTIEELPKIEIEEDGDKKAI